jgi:hypothetical protein
MICHACKKTIPVAEKIGFREECPLCGADLHVCLACGFYDKSAYNECRESQADRVLEKDRANFCEYFTPGTGAHASSSPTSDAKKKLEELFKKK